MDIIVKKEKIVGIFVGPSTISLEMNNIVPLKVIMFLLKILIIHILLLRKQMAKEKLLFIASNKKVYLIDINLNIQFTGMICQNTDYLNTIIDGEHVLYDKNGNYINYYLCFDIYWLNGEDMRIYAFSDFEGMKYHQKIEEPKFRLVELEKQYTTLI